MTLHLALLDHVRNVHHGKPLPEGSDPPPPMLLITGLREPPQRVFILDLAPELGVASPREELGRDGLEVALSGSETGGKMCGVR